MLSKTYHQGFKLKKLFFLLCICFCVTLWDSWSEADETHAYGKYWNIAMKLQKQKRYKEAESVFSVAISKHPNVAKFHLMRAKFRQHYMNNYRDAISGYNIVIKIAPKSYPEAHWWRGVCLYKFGLYEQAIRDYSNALLIKPRWGKLHLLRAKAYAKLNMIEKARTDLKATVKYNPKYTQAVRDLWKKILEGRRDF
jgi:tetratricopeptide (TPR) repeat protein